MGWGGGGLEDLFAHGAGEDAHGFAVFGDGAASDVDVVGGEHFGDF